MSTKYLCVAHYKLLGTLEQVHYSHRQQGKM